MERLSIDPEEMALRQDRDFIDSLKMVGEGGTSTFSFNYQEEDDDVEDREFPRAYQ